MAAEGRAPFIIGGVDVPRGKSRRIELPVARLPTGTWLSLPVAVVRGKKPGPTVWLDAAIHGDELNGIEVIRRVLKHLSPRNLSGTLVAVPIVNVFGLIEESRYLPDRRDLNRSFPGSKRGSLASRLAHLFMEEVVSKCEVGIDYHTGSGYRTNLPQIRCDLDEPHTARLAEVFGAPVMMHATLRDGSLRAAVRRLGLRVLLYEGGEALRFDHDVIEIGVDGTLRVLRHLGMITEDVPEAAWVPQRSRSSTWLRARWGGFCHFMVGLGDRVQAGQPVATITDALGDRSTTLKSRDSGVVIGRAVKPLVNRGDALVHVAKIENDSEV